jgi:hypothetical protein
MGVFVLTSVGPGTPLSLGVVEREIESRCTEVGGGVQRGGVGKAWFAH